MRKAPEKKAEQKTVSLINQPEMLRKLILEGDLRYLDATEKVQYYNKLCQSVGLNPLTQPFSYITMKGKEVLYANRNATDQIREIRGISVTNVQRDISESEVVVTVYVQDKAGRTDSSIGVLPLTNLKGDDRANQIMKAETKAKRRATLSIAGLSFLDESELESTVQVEYPEMSWAETRKTVEQAKEKVINPEPVDVNESIVAEARQWFEHNRILEKYKVKAMQKFSADVKGLRNWQRDTEKDAAKMSVLRGEA